MLQKRPIRTITTIITISKYNAHTEPLCKALNIIKLPDMCNLQLINYTTKYIYLFMW